MVAVEMFGNLIRPRSFGPDVSICPVEEGNSRVPQSGPGAVWPVAMWLAVCCEAPRSSGMCEIQAADLTGLRGPAPCLQVNAGRFRQEEKTSSPR